MKQVVVSVLLQWCLEGGGVEPAARERKRKRGRESDAGQGRTLPPCYTLAHVYRFYMVSSHLRCVQPSSQRSMGVRLAFLSNPIATRWNSCSSRRGDAFASSYSPSSWVLLDLGPHPVAVPLLLSLFHRARSVPVFPRCQFHPETRSSRCHAPQRIHHRGASLIQIPSGSTRVSASLFAFLRAEDTLPRTICLPQLGN